MQILYWNTPESGLCQGTIMARDGHIHLRNIPKDQVEIFNAMACELANVQERLPADISDLRIFLNAVPVLEDSKFSPYMVGYQLKEGETLTEDGIAAAKAAIAGKVPRRKAAITVDTSKKPETENPSSSTSPAPATPSPEPPLKVDDEVVEVGTTEPVMKVVDVEDGLINCIWQDAADAQQSGAFKPEQLIVHSVSHSGTEQPA